MREKRSAIEFYNEIAKRFDSNYKSSSSFMERFHVWVKLFSLFLKPDDKVMDLGCGSGIFSMYLAKTGCQVTGVDGSVAMIELCQEKNQYSNATFLVETLPFHDVSRYGNHDALIASSLLEYIDNIDLMLNQMNCLLKKNGYLFVSMPNQQGFYRRFEKLLFPIIGHPRYFAYVKHRYTKDAFDELMKKHGFKSVATQYYGVDDPISIILSYCLPKRYVNNLFVVVYQKTQPADV